MNAHEMYQTLKWRSVFRSATDLI